MRGSQHEPKRPEAPHAERRGRAAGRRSQLTHECLAIRIARRLKAVDVVGVRSGLFIRRVASEHVRSNNVPELTAKIARDWIAALTEPRPPASPPAAHGRTVLSRASMRLRDELLDGEVLYSLVEAKIVFESWRRHYNTERPHGSLGYRPPAPEVFIPTAPGRPSPQRRPASTPALAPRPTLN